jgi:hypothetical protein
MKLTPDARQWYKMHSVQAALLLAVLETVQMLQMVTLPEGATILIALLIPVLRIVKQETIKAGE